MWKDITLVCFLKELGSNSTFASSEPDCQTAKYHFSFLLDPWDCYFVFFVVVCFCLFLLFFNFYFYCYSITVVCLLSPSLHCTPAEPTSLPHLHPPPWFSPCVLYSSSCNPLSSLSPPHSSLPIVRLFLTSVSLVIFCLLFSSTYYVPVKGEIIWYLSLTIWLIF